MSTEYNKTMENDDEFDELHIDVENVGGISKCDVTLSPGVTLLVGENASNKSSFLRSLSTVLGGPAPSIKSDAENGHVYLKSDEKEYSIELSNRNGNQTITTAEQFIDREDLCELFVTLDEANPIRQAVVNGGDLYSLLMRPVDTERIESEIKRLKNKKDTLDERLSELNRIEDKLPALQTRSNNLRQKIEEVKTTLQQKRDEIEKQETETREGSDSETLEKLKEKRSEQETIRNQIRTQKNAIDSLQDELSSVTDQLEELDLDDVPSNVDGIKREIEQLHHQKQQLTTTINSLSPIVEMNSQLLDDEDDIPTEMKSEDVVAELDPTSRTITCWTCGKSVERSEIAEQVRVVKEIVQEKRNQRKTISDQIQTLKEKRQKFKNQKENRERLLEQKRSTENEIERREQKLPELQTRQDSLKEEIDSLQKKVEEVGDQSDVLSDLYDEVSDLEYKRGQLKKELSDIEEEINHIEAKLSERSDLNDERESVATQLQEQRDRIETLERDLVSTFNQIMQQMLDMLNYEKVERVWIERLVSGDHRSNTTKFELHIVRSTEDGSAYEETIENLSKSEREVISLVVALAGYVAHEVAEELPVIVIDAVEMLDAERIKGLLEYFSQYAHYVVMSVLPEEGKELEDQYPTMSTSSLNAET